MDHSGSEYGTPVYQSVQAYTSWIHTVANPGAYSGLHTVDNPGSPSGLHTVATPGPHSGLHTMANPAGPYSGLHTMANSGPCSGLHTVASPGPWRPCLFVRNNGPNESHRSQLVHPVLEAVRGPALQPT